MPEGPEAKKIVDQLNAKIRNNYLIDINIVSGRYLKHQSPDGLDGFKKLLPLQVESINCKGKFIYWNMSDQVSSIWNTLGMTGSWGTSPSHKRVEFVFEDINGEKYNIYFSDIRNFGTLKFSNSKKELQEKLNSIGPDMLSSPPSFTEFREIFKKEGASNICRSLMDQSVISGVGNYIKAEALYLSRLSPHRSCRSVTSDELLLLYNSIIKVITDSYGSGGSTFKTYKDFNGDTGSYSSKLSVYGKRIDPLGNPVAIIETPDKRKTHWVPLIQF